MNINQSNHKNRLSKMGGGFTYPKIVEHPNPTTKIGSLKWVVNSPTNHKIVPLVLTPNLRGASSAGRRRGRLELGGPGHTLGLRSLVEAGLGLSNLRGVCLGEVGGAGGGARVGGGRRLGGVVGAGGGWELGCWAKELEKLACFRNPRQGSPTASQMSV